MCDKCSRWYAQLGSDKPLRDALDENEIAKYQQLKEIRDSRKLDAMMPAWIKAHRAAVAPPKPFVFVPGLPPKFPAWCKVPVGVGALVALDCPDYTEGMTLAQYVAAFDKMHSLKPLHA